MERAAKDGRNKLNSPLTGLGSFTGRYMPQYHMAHNKCTHNAILASGLTTRCKLIVDRNLKYITKTYLLYQPSSPLRASPNSRWSTTYEFPHFLLQASHPMVSD